MSIARSATAEMPIAADPVPSSSTKNPPHNRTATAMADAVQQPEAR